MFIHCILALNEKKYSNKLSQLPVSLDLRPRVGAVRDYTPSPLLSLKFFQKRVGLFSRGYGTVQVCVITVYSIYIRIEKQLQCEKLLGLAGGNTKKHGNKKSGESKTPIRYNIIHMYISRNVLV